MLVSSADWSISKDGARVTFLVPSIEDARMLAEQVSDGKQYVLTVKEYHPKRSLSANALMWAVIGDIAKAMNQDSNEVYRKYIKELPYYVVAEIWEEDLERAKSTWESNGIGWMFEPTEICEDSGGLSKWVCRMWYGSSQYDTAQMKRLIDSIQQDADAIGLVSENMKRLIEAYPDGQ